MTKKPSPQKKKKSSKKKTNINNNQQVTQNRAIIVRPPSTSKSLDLKRMPMGMTVDAICALVDPFCQHAVGVKYPDKSAAKTLALTQHFKGLLATDATGSGCVLILPGFTYGTAVCAVSVLTATATTLNTFPSTGITPSFYRIVSMGLRLRCQVSPLNASGMVYIRSYGAQNGTSFATFNMATYSADATLDIPVSAINASGSTDIIFRKTDETTSMSFVDPAITNPSNLVSAWVSPGFGAVSIGISGAAASSFILDVEYVVHYELMFPDSDILALAATPSRPANEQLSTIASNVNKVIGTTFSGIADDVGLVVRKTAQAALMEAVRRYGPSSVLALM